MRRSPIAAVCLMAVAATTWARAARAAEVDEGSGTIRFADGAVGLSLDDPELPAGVEVKLLDAGGEPVEDLAGRFVTEELPLEGSGSLAMGGDAPIAIFDLEAALGDLMDRRVEVTLWQKAMGTEVNAQIVWSGEMLGQVLLVPTGRATDDGWRELSSGPIDLRLAAAVGSPFVLAFDAQLGGSLDKPTAKDTRVHLDALEVRDLGPAAVPDAACTLLDEDTVCGELGACFYGRCADAAAVVGPNLDSPKIRADYLDRIVHLYRTFEGGRASQSALPAMASLLDGVKSGAPARATWSAVRAGVDSLADAHASAPRTGAVHLANLGVCLHLGEADLLPEGGARPMVFSTTADNPIAERVQAGDVLVRIDGVPVDDWVAAAGRLVSYGGDGAAKAVTIAPEIMAYAATTGATLELARCTSGTACTAAEVETIEIDLGALLGVPMLAGAPPAWAQDNAACDYRFRRFSESNDVASFAHVFTTEQDGVRVFEFNGFPHPTVSGHVAWMNAAEEAFAAAPTRALLDERTGYGGHPAPVYRLGGYLVDPADLYRVDFYPWFEGSVAQDSLGDLRSCSQKLNYCGNYHSDDIFSAHPGPGASATTRLAVLLSMDVSGNDFFTEILGYREAETRFFGPAPTRGGFGEVYWLPGSFGESFGGSIQVQDSAFSASADDPTVAFLSGTGVPPHEIVLQKQSDARSGVDTMIETAMAWVNQ